MKSSGTNGSADWTGRWAAGAHCSSAQPRVLQLQVALVICLQAAQQDQEVTAQRAPPIQSPHAMLASYSFCSVPGVLV